MRRPPAVRGIDFDVSRGEIFGLLGPNGAGKTTTVEILEGYRQRTAGEIAVLGIDPETRDLELRRHVGIVLQSTGFYTRATVRESVEHMAVAYPNPRDPAETIELVGLRGKEDQRVGRLSGGQQRRLDLALALVGDPSVIFLDEPTELLHRLTGEALARGERLQNLSVSRPTLEDVYLELTAEAAEQ